MRYLFKKCLVCGNEFILRSPYGKCCFSGECLKIRILRKARANKKWAKENREKVRKAHQRYDKKSKELRRRYYAENKAKILEYQRRYRAKHPEKDRERQRKCGKRWYEVNKRRALEDQRRYRFRLRQEEVFDVIRKLNQTGGKKP